MENIFFLFAMLVSVAASAQTTVQITPVSATYTTTPTIQFEVRWINQSTDNHRNKVWIFVDFQPVISPTQKGNWQPATITTVQKTAGTVSGQSNRGFFLEGTTTGFSSTVTVQFSNTGTPFNWCAYGSDYPPNVTLEKGTYTFKGTTDFIVSNPAQTVTTATIPQASLTVTAPSTFTDATGCPGIGSLYCPYTGSDLYMDATHLCQQRASGAQNWEAWIKDTRDNELYRVVLMPDNKWWLAQNVKLASYDGKTVGAPINGNCSIEDCGRAYTPEQAYASYGGSSGSTGNVQGVCPSGWVLPISTDFSLLIGSISPNYDVAAALRPLNSYCTPVNDTYGWAGAVAHADGYVNDPRRYCNYYGNDGGQRHNKFMIDCNPYTVPWSRSCGSVGLLDGSGTNPASVRCFRQL
ncbi:MAG: hypothetical protein LBU42_07650 [Prevotellaceae bacterium]|jgi:uncharacterized protein (TIGR02145 family)|nr:hypothetical protein [Prevotellaceae bacterium]